MKKTRKLQTCKTVHLNQNEVVKIAPSKSQFWSQLESMESIFTRIFLGSNELFTRTVNKQVNKNLDDVRKKYEIPSELVSLGQFKPTSASNSETKKSSKYSNCY